jgi:hypothetical protein
MYKCAGKWVALFQEAATSTDLLALLIREQSERRRQQPASLLFSFYIHANMFVRAPPRWVHFAPINCPLIAILGKHSLRCGWAFLCV